MVTVRFFRRQAGGDLQWTENFGPFAALRLRGDQLLVAELDPIATLLVEKWVCKVGSYKDTQWDGVVMKSHKQQSQEPSEN